MQTYQHFKCLNPAVDVAPLLDEINRNEDAFGLNTTRQDGVHVQRNTETIFLRTAVDRPDIGINQNQETQWDPVAERFPLACAFMEDVARNQGGSLSRATIVRLKPNEQVKDVLTCLDGLFKDDA